MLSSIKAEMRAGAKKVLPRWCIHYLEESRQFGPRERVLYRGLRSRSRRAPATGSSMSARSMMFICYGNIMRSPMAAALVRQMLPRELRDNSQVVSAGLHANPDHEADPRSLRIAPEFGIRLERHRSTLLTRQMVAEADAVFAMDRSNQVEFLALYPEAKEKLFMLGAYAEPKLSEIADPFMGNEEDLRRCYRTLQVCICNLVRDLTRGERCGRYTSKFER